jgi:hypothetical protein
MASKFNELERRFRALEEASSKASEPEHKEKEQSSTPDA